MATRFRKLVFLLHLMLLIVLSLSWWAPNVSPRQNDWFSIIGMAFPYLMIINSIATLYWIILRKKITFIGLLSILVFGSTLFRFIQFNNQSEQHDIKVLSFNVRAFNKNTWKKKIDSKKEVLEFMNSEKADIICFQEFYDSRSKKNYRTIKEIKKQTNYKNSYWEDYYSNKNKKNQSLFGLAIFTPHKIVHKGIVFRHRNRKKAKAIFADLLINSDTIRIYNLHLQSISFGKEDYKFLGDITDNPGDQAINKSKTIVAKLRKAYRRRAIEADSIVKHIRKSPHPFLVIGDFNEIPNTYAYKKIADQLKDGFIEKGKGFGFSYEGKGIMPGQRIDYILSSPEFDFQSFSTHSEVKVSDHKPLSATLTLNLSESVD